MIFLWKYKNEFPLENTKQQIIQRTKKEANDFNIKNIEKILKGKPLEMHQTVPVVANASYVLANPLILKDIDIFIFFIFIFHLPSISKKYVYADDLALKSVHKDFPEIERDLSQDVDTLSTYFANWRLKLNTGKTVSSMFHLANRKANYELNVTNQRREITL